MEPGSGDGTEEASRLLAVSVWQRPTVPLWESDALANRQANAAITLHLLRRGGNPEREPLAELLRDRSPTAEPTSASERRTELRGQLVARLGALGVEGETVLRRLNEEKDLTARRALILALGEYGSDHLTDAQRGPMVTRLLEWYQTDPDAGVHGAIDWLLRQSAEGPASRPAGWFQGDTLERLDREMARNGRQPLDRGTSGLLRPRGGRKVQVTMPEKPSWWVAPSGQTFTVIPGPVEFQMGAPLSQPDRKDSELLHRRRIGRSFAVSTKPVTVAQFREFLKAHPEIKHSYDQPLSPDPQCPMISVTWFEAAQFCRWLSEREGVPEDQMCYPSVAEIEKCTEGAPLKLPVNYLSRTGYRMATEAEWEYACRAGAATSRFFGSDEKLLDRYAWHDGNSGDRAWPVGQKRPNDLGLFDMLGNVWQWCQDPPQVYRDGWRGRPYQPNEEYRDIEDRFEVVCRGGAFDSRRSSVRCAARSFDRPSAVFSSAGFRIARTW
jgi:formylglycine-generating enzyme required for sulfatase activity